MTAVAYVASKVGRTAVKKASTHLDRPLPLVVWYGIPNHVVPYCLVSGHVIQPFDHRHKVKTQWLQLHSCHAIAKSCSLGHNRSNTRTLFTPQPSYIVSVPTFACQYPRPEDDQV